MVKTMTITYKDIVKDIFKELNITLNNDEIDKAREVLMRGLRNVYIEQFMFVEDGSIKEKDIKEIKRRNPEIKVIIYRQGSPAPIIQDC